MNVTLQTGYSKQVKKIRYVPGVPAVEEEGHWRILREYPETGGKDVEWVVDKPGSPAIPEHTEEYWEEEWIEYSPSEMRDQEISILKKYLADTDYVVIKIYEASVTGHSDEVLNLQTLYSEILTNRQEARARINELEAQ